MIELELVVESTEVSAATIARRLSIEPSRVHIAGRSSGGSGRGAPVHRWSLSIPVPAFHAGGEEGISAELLALGVDVADRLRGLVDEGCVVLVILVQRVTDPPNDAGSVGIELTTEAIAWMARARAALVIDQYLD